MTAAELYECDPGFRGFLAAWEADRRCPLELCDYLLDRDMEGPAECARWAAEGDQWESWGGTMNVRVSGRFPWHQDWKQTYLFRQLVGYDSEQNNRSHRYPGDRVRKDVLGDITGPTPALAIVALMDAWVVPVCDGVTVVVTGIDK